MSKFIPFHGVLKDDKRNASVPCGQSAAGQPQFLFRWRPWWGLWETIIFWALRVVQRDVVLPVLRGICWRWNQQSPENLFQTKKRSLAKMNVSPAANLQEGCCPAAGLPGSAPGQGTWASLWARHASRPAWCRIYQQRAAPSQQRRHWLNYKFAHISSLVS